MKNNTSCRLRLFSLLLVLLLTAAAVCSCAKAEADTDYYANYSAKTDGGSMGYDGGYPAAPSYSAEYTVAEDQASTAVSDAQQVQKLIRTCQIQAETTDYDGAAATVDTLLAQVGGYVESRRDYVSGYYAGLPSHTLTLTMRVPAGRLDEFTGQLGDTINVTRFDSDTKNVTEAYLDAQARLETLETERTSLLAMMASLDNAKDYEFWYKLHVRVSEVEQDIAVLTATLKNYDSLVSYSTVTLNLTEVVTLSPVTEPTFFDRIKKAFTESWKDFAEGWKDFAVFMVEAIPTLIVLALIGFVIFLIVRAIVRRSRKKRQAKTDAANNSAQ